jgi:hypothetical protein
MKWYDNLYVGESLKGKEKRIRWKIEHRAGTVSIYVIAFASNPDNLLDMIPARELMQRAYPKENLRIIGLAKGYKEGLSVITRIIDETYRATGDVDVYTYLKETRGSGA